MAVISAGLKSSSGRPAANTSTPARLAAVTVPLSRVAVVPGWAA